MGVLKSSIARWQKHKKLWLKLLAIAALALLIVGISSLKHFPDFVERYYSAGFYPVLSHTLQSFFDLFPFSIGDIFYVVICLVISFFVIQFIKNLFSKNFKASAHLLLNAIITLQSLIVIFYLFWGINYFRQPAAQRLNLMDTCYTTAQLQQLTLMLVDSANVLRRGLYKTDLQRTDKEIFNTAKGAVELLSTTIELPKFNPKIKPSIFSSLLNYFGTAGYYNPFTSEAQLNNQMPVFLKPVTACHEMSHQMGYAAEDEANFAGYVAGTLSKDRLLNYSAYYLGLAECMSDLRGRDSVAYKNLRNKISPLVLNDFKADREYWMKYHGRVGAVTSLLFDNYLKVNNQPEGIRRYNLMVRLTVAWYKRKGILQSGCVKAALD